MMANCFVPGADGVLCGVKILYDQANTSLSVYRGKQLEQTYQLTKARIDVTKIVEPTRYYKVLINGSTIFFQQLDDIVQLIQNLKIKLHIEQFCEIMGYPAPTNVADKYRIDAIPAAVLQKAHEKKQQKDAPNVDVVFPDSDEESSVEEADNLDEEDQKLLTAFLQTRQSSLFIVRNLHIVQVPVADIFCLNLCREYAYVQVIAAGEQFEVNVIADPELRVNARDSLFASVQSMELCKAASVQYKQTSTKRIDIAEFGPVDKEPSVDDSQELSAIPQAILTQTGVCLRKAGFETKRKHFKANKTLTVAQINNGKAQRLLVETFATLPFLPLDKPKPAKAQQKIVLQGIYIFNLNNQYAIQYAASRDFTFHTDNFTYEFKKPSISDRGAALYYLQQLKIAERRTAVVDEQDLYEIHKVCAGVKQKHLNLKGLNSSQQLLVEAVLSCRDSVVKRGLFDTDTQLSSLKKEDEEYFDELYQLIPQPSFIVFENNVPTPKTSLNYRDLKENESIFVKAGYNMYNWMGRTVSQELRNFCIAYRVRFAAEVMPQGSERGDFRVLFSDFGDLNAQQIKDFKAELNKQLVLDEVRPMETRLDFESFLSERSEAFERPSKFSLKYHVVTDQTNVNYDVNGGYNWGLKPLAKAPENYQVAQASSVIHLFSSMAHLVTFYCPELERPYRVFVWRGYHAQNSQVFTQGSQFWVGEAAQKLFAQKLIKTRTEQQFDESAAFLGMFDVLVYHLGQYKRFEGAERKAWQLGFTHDVNTRDRFRIFKVFEHFNDRSKICFQEQVVFNQYNEIQLDPTNALVSVDYQDQVVYVKFGRKIAPYLQEFVMLRVSDIFDLQNYKLYAYDDFKPKLLKFFKIAELPYKQDAPATILEAWRVDLTDRRISLKYQFNFDQINTGGSLYILKHGCLSKNYVVVPKLFKEHEMLACVQAELKAQKVEFGLLDFRDQRLEMENLLTLSALLPSFVGVKLAYTDPFAGHRMAYYYGCCLYYWRLQRELVARDFHSGVSDSKALTTLDQKVQTSFFKSITERNVVFEEYLKKFVPQLAEKQLSAVQKKVGFGIKKTGISIVIGGEDLDQDEE